MVEHRTDNPHSELVQRLRKPTLLRFGPLSMAHAAPDLVVFSETEVLPLLAGCADAIEALQAERDAEKQRADENVRDYELDTIHARQQQEKIEAQAAEIARLTEHNLRLKPWAHDAERFAEERDRLRAERDEAFKQAEAAAREVWATVQDSASLRAELAAALKACSEWGAKEYLVRLERDRLRAALERIASGTEDDAPPYRVAPESVLRCIASEALKGEKSPAETTKIWGHISRDPTRSAEWEPPPDEKTGGT